uniref:Uncharacterized protein n=1 Tax=Rhizophora mucronata TaxID=61149 RepID=A0A2P2IMN4_RHIMU
MEAHKTFINQFLLNDAETEFCSCMYLSHHLLSAPSSKKEIEKVFLT